MGELCDNMQAVEPGADPASAPGGTTWKSRVRTDVSSRFWSRIKRFGGPMIGGHFNVESYDKITGAVAFFSQSRVPIG